MTSTQGCRMNVWQSPGLSPASLKPAPPFGTFPGPPSFPVLTSRQRHQQASWQHGQALAEINDRRGCESMAVLSAAQTH